MKVLMFTLGCLALSVNMASACQGHDSTCRGDNGAQGDCCAGMYCQKNDPSWAEGRCFYNPGRKRREALLEDEDTPASISSTSSLPRSSCDSSLGLLCLPDACQKKTCTLMPQAICLADRCGCEARFFKWNPQEKAYQDYSRLCHIAEHLTKVERFANESKQNDEATGVTAGATTPPNNAANVGLLRSWNRLIVEVLLDLGRYLQDVVKTDPSQKNIDKLRLVFETVEKLRASSPSGAVSDEGIPSERAWRRAVKTGSRLINTAIQKLLDEDGQFADEIASGKVAISDKNVREQLLLTRRFCLLVCW
ncbi:hypothetical protein RvY_17070 [Ramazzottius varieornatus]|uniref:EB domain-containing protein n=1 Tax=Ramazzottius varieornatus TaxID=947166 RepID=A0A1D1W807_RAMVA|nr:hypothetical protein RvY_17070 [Ramazzottius varieornatus]